MWDLPEEGVLGLVEVGRLGEYIGRQEVVLVLLPLGSACCKKKVARVAYRCKKLGPV